MPVPTPGNNHNLPEGLIAWLEDLGAGTVTRLERHVARREAWIVDITARDGAVMEGFLRLDREPVANANASLRREARICRALMSTPVPAPALLGWNEAQHAALFARDPGSADLPGVKDRQRQRAIMEDFMAVIAKLHQLDLDRLALDDILGPQPRTAAESALGDLDAQLSQYAGFLATYRDPLLSYGASWLRRFVPEKVARVSLVQGDTGPVNFMFQGDRVSAVVDWEWGHWGDPMEDLGNICVREFWNPSGGLTGLFKLYEQISGIPYTRFAAQYYRIQQNVRGMIPIHAACANASLRESLAWYLCYRYVGDRATCEALADAMSIDIERPALPAGPCADNLLLTAARTTLQRDVLPDVSTPHARSRLRDADILVQCAQRQHEFGEEIAAIECQEIASLLKSRPRGLEASNNALVHAIEQQQLADEPLIAYLARKAYRDEWLYQPATALYPNCEWSALD